MKLNQIFVRQEMSQIRMSQTRTVAGIVTSWTRDQPLSQTLPSAPAQMTAAVQSASVLFITYICLFVLYTHIL